MFDFAFDPATGILSVHVEGSWNLAEIERYSLAAGLEFGKARQRAGALRLLVELSGAKILSQDLIAPLAQAGMRYARADDHVALVVGSMLMKLQMKRMIGEAPTPIFLSGDEAATWLIGAAEPKAG